MKPWRLYAVVAVLAAGLAVGIVKSVASPGPAASTKPATAKEVTVTIGARPVATPKPRHRVTGTTVSGAAQRSSASSESSGDSAQHTELTVINNSDAANAQTGQTTLSNGKQAEVGNDGPEGPP